MVTMNDAEKALLKRPLSYCQLLEPPYRQTQKRGLQARISCRLVPILPFHLQNKVFTSLCQPFKQVVILSTPFFHAFFSPRLTFIFLIWFLYPCVQGIEKMFSESFLQKAGLTTFKIWVSLFLLTKYIVGEVVKLVPTSFHVDIWDVFRILDPHCDHCIK